MNMKRNFTVILALVFAAMLAWHFAIERQRSIVIIVDGVPASTGLQQFASLSPPIMPDASGRYTLPSDMPPRSGFEFKSGPNTNWLFNFPDAGTKRFEISGSNITTTITLNYFGIYRSSQTSRSDSILKPNPDAG